MHSGFEVGKNALFHSSLFVLTIVAIVSIIFALIRWGVGPPRGIDHRLAPISIDRDGAGADEDCGSGILRGLSDLDDLVKVTGSVCYLDLSRVGLTEVPAVVFGFHSLKGLWLNCNRIASIPPDIANLAHLEFIDLTGNPVSEHEVSKLKAYLPQTNIIAMRLPC